MMPINHNPSSRQLTLFGLLWMVFFFFWGTVLWRKTGAQTAAGGCWLAAVVVPAIGLLIPGWLRLVYLVLAYATYPVGWVVSHMILAVIYYLVLTPIALVMRLFGYDPMHRGFDERARSYWTPRVETRSVERYFRQF